MARRFGPAKIQEARSRGRAALSGRDQDPEQQQIAARNRNSRRRWTQMDTHPQRGEPAAGQGPSRKAFPRAREWVQGRAERIARNVGYADGFTGHVRTQGQIIGPGRNEVSCLDTIQIGEEPQAAPDIAGPLKTWVGRNGEILSRKSRKPRAIVLPTADDLRDE